MGLNMKNSINETECTDAEKLTLQLDLKYNISFLYWWKQDGIWKLVIVFDNYNSLDRNEIKDDISKAISSIGIASFDTSDCAPSGTNIIDQSLRMVASIPSKQFLRVEMTNSSISQLHIEHTIILRG